MRQMNRVKIVSDDKVILGPGATWGEVLKAIPPENYTLIHGQCLSVGVGGYLLGKVIYNKPVILDPDLVF